MRLYRKVLFLISFFTSGYICLINSDSLRIAGKVIDAFGKGIDSVKIDYSSLTFEQTAFSNIDGNFEIANLIVKTENVNLKASMDQSREKKILFIEKENRKVNSSIMFDAKGRKVGFIDAKNKAHATYFMPIHRSPANYNANNVKSSILSSFGSITLSKVGRCALNLNVDSLVQDFGNILLPAPGITLVKPNGGENYKIGDSIKAYLSLGIGEKRWIFLDISNDSSKTWHQLSPPQLCEGMDSITAKIPGSLFINFELNDFMPGQYLLRAADYECVDFDVSDDYITIIK